jgi:hypothetical protein
MTQQSGSRFVLLGYPFTRFSFPSVVPMFRKTLERTTRFVILAKWIVWNLFIYIKRFLCSVSNCFARLLSCAVVRSDDIQLWPTSLPSLWGTLLINHPKIQLESSFSGLACVFVLATRMLHLYLPFSFVWGKCIYFLLLMLSKPHWLSIFSCFSSKNYISTVFGWRESTLFSRKRLHSGC